MPRLNFFFCIECNLVHIHNTRYKNSTMLSRILHMSMKYGIHGILPLDYKKR
jgi:hypothetical protein